MHYFLYKHEINTIRLKLPNLFVNQKEARGVTWVTQFICVIFGGNIFCNTHVQLIQSEASKRVELHIR